MGFALYLLIVATFLLFVNIKASSTPTKFASYVGMWAALIGSAIVAIGALT